MDQSKIRQLVRKHEGPKHDFKVMLQLDTESERKELTRDVIAIANSRGGRGYIIFGIEDKTQKVVGVKREDFNEEQIQQIIYSRSDPPVTVGLDFVQYQEKTLAILVIYRSMHYPHQMLSNGTFYIRRGSTTDVARRSEIAGMMQENGVFSHETSVIRNAGLDSLDQDQISLYLDSLGVFSDRPNEIIMDAMGIIGDGEGGRKAPTVGGMLLFGKNPMVYLPHAHVKVEGNGDAEILSGSIVPLLDLVMSRVHQLMDRQDYPYQAVEEAVANALAHRDYLDYTRGITVSIHDRTLEITNPGALISGTTLHRTVRPDQISRRNPWLYQRLLTLDRGKRFLKSGKGMARIKAAFSQIGEVKFVSIGTSNLFKVIFPFNR
jgi:predicted HTH transcriptional regulator